MNADQRGCKRDFDWACVSWRSSMLFGLFFVLMWWSASATVVVAAPADKLMLPPDYVKLIPLHVKLSAPRPSDWLAQHAEPGQTFRQYLRNRPVKVDRKRRTLYIQPLGEFSQTQKKIIDATTEFMGVYFQLPVKTREGLSLDLIPPAARRKPGVFRSEQILTTYVLYDVLKPRLPRDAVAMIAFTTSDLWPGEGWNYLFGQAALKDRVGVWSIHRNGDSDAGDEAFLRCLRRTLKTATHETGHMFSIPHCTLYECNMNGCNHLTESDRHPLSLCPHCLAKICYATGADPVVRFQKLILLYKAHRLKAEQAFCEKSLAALRRKKKR